MPREIREYSYIVFVGDRNGTTSTRQQLIDKIDAALASDKARITSGHYDITISRRPSS